MDASSVAFRPCLRGLLFFGLSAPLLLSGCLPSSQTSVQPYPHRAPAPQAPLLPLPSEPPPVQTKQAMSPQERADYQRQVLEPTLATISGRIAAYEQRLHDWQDLGGSRETLRLSASEVEQIVSCRNMVADLQDAYKNLQEQLLREQSVEDSRELLFSSLQDFKEKDIAYLEGECPRLYSSLSSLNSRRPGAAEVPDENEGAARRGQTELHSRRSETERSQPADDPSASQQQEPPPDTGTLRSKGMELLRQGQEQEARSMFNELLAAARQTANRKQEIAALQMLAELDFGRRDYAVARKKYEELRRLGVSDGKAARNLEALELPSSRRDELDAYSSLLLGCLTYNPDKDGFTVVQQAAEFVRLFPDSPLVDDAEDCSQDIEQQAERWFSGLLAEADRLESAAALAKLEQVPLDILPLDKQDILREKKESLAPEQQAASAAPDSVQSSPEQVPPQTASPLSSLDPLQETWDKGMAAMQVDEHDKAITLFSELRNTSFDAKAEGKIKEAEQQAAEVLRKKAAALFQQANNAAEPALKKELLLSSRSLLEEALRKYPQSGIADKVKRNLNSVAKELAASGGGQ
uniref:hypothetical protein n=1 Tax=Candidatus Electronema sp. TaxID=2698783 RepID=UPI004055B638